MNHDDLIEISRQEISAYFHGRALEKDNERLTAENAKLREQLAEAKRLLRNVTQAHENDLYFRLAEAHEWLTVNDNTTA